jgi:uncharacterized membrane protein
MEVLLCLVALLVLASPVVCFFLLMRVLKRQTYQDSQIKELQKTQEKTLLKVLTIVENQEVSAVAAPAESAQASEGQPESKKEEPKTDKPSEKPAQPVLPASEPIKPVRTEHVPRPVPAMARTAEATPPPLPHEPGKFERKAREVIGKVWNWIIVGEEHRPGNLSVEFAVASNWLLRLGIVIVVVGVGFFLKYAIDAGLLPPRARVSLSLLAGVLMLGVGTRLFKGKYRLLGQGLVGGGFAVLYFSIFAAFSFYGFLGQFSAFGLMAMVTVAAGLLAIRFNTLLIALLGLLGGYGTPIMLSTGIVDFTGLYGYLLLLGCGVFLTAARKNWHLLNSLSLMLTYGLAVLALVKAYEPALFWQVMLFFTAFFILFSTMTFIHNLLRRTDSNLLEVLTLFVNAGVFFVVGYILIVDNYASEWAGALTVALAAFYTLHVYYMLIRKRQDRGLLLSFLGLAAFFLSITMPIILSEAWITVSWSMEALVLIWIAGKMQSRFLRQLAYAVYLFVLWRMLFCDLSAQYGQGAPATTGQTFTVYAQHLLQRIVAFGVPIASFALASRLIRNDASSTHVTVDKRCDTAEWLPRNWAVRGILILAGVLAFAILQFEINRSFAYLFEPLRMPMLTLIWVGLGEILFNAFSSTGRRGLGFLFRIIFGVLLLKLLVVDLMYWRLDVNTFRFAGEYSAVAALMRLLDFSMVIVLAFYAFNSLRRTNHKVPCKDQQALGYCGLVLMLIILTFELNTCMAAFVPGLRAGGISILWSVFALGMILTGILKEVTTLRYAGLVLFAVVVAKIFFSDLALLDPVYRIIAFIVLGIVVLCGSFVYLTFQQRFERETPENVEKK